MIFPHSVHLSRTSALRMRIEKSWGKSAFVWNRNLSSFEGDESCHNHHGFEHSYDVDCSTCGLDVLSICRNGNLFPLMKFAPQGCARGCRQRSISPSLLWQFSLSRDFPSGFVEENGGSSHGFPSLPVPFSAASHSSSLVCFGTEAIEILKNSERTWTMKSVGWFSLTFRMAPTDNELKSIAHELNTSSDWWFRLDPCFSLDIHSKRAEKNY